MQDVRRVRHEGLQPDELSRQGVPRSRPRLQHAPEISHVGRSHQDKPYRESGTSTLEGGATGKPGAYTDRDRTIELGTSTRLLGGRTQGPIQPHRRTPVDV